MWVMYKHEHSKQCKYQRKCSNKLCQFKHSETKEYSCNRFDNETKLNEDFDEHTANHDGEEIDSNEDIADQSLGFENDLDDEKYFDKSYPDYYKKYVKTNLDGGKYVDCYYCGFCTSHAGFVHSTAVMIDHIS